MTHTTAWKRGECLKTHTDGDIPVFALGFLHLEGSSTKKFLLLLTRTANADFERGAKALSDDQHIKLTSFDSTLATGKVQHVPTEPPLQGDELHQALLNADAFLLKALTGLTTAETAAPAAAGANLRERRRSSPPIDGGVEEHPHKAPRISEEALHEKRMEKSLGKLESDMRGFISAVDTNGDKICAQLQTLTDVMQRVHTEMIQSAACDATRHGELVRVLDRAHLARSGYIEAPQPTYAIPPPAPQPQYVVASRQQHAPAQSPPDVIESHGILYVRAKTQTEAGRSV